MKLTGTVDIMNRLAQSTGFGARSRIGRPCKGVLQVRNKPDGRQILVLSTKKEISAQEYDIRSIQTFRTQFIEDGFATIEISQPPMNIMLRNCDTEELRTFINYLKTLLSEKKSRSARQDELVSQSAKRDQPAIKKERSKDIEIGDEKPGSLRKSFPIKRARSPDLSKNETEKIKRCLQGSDKVISVRTRANYPKEIPPTIEKVTILGIGLKKIDKRILKLQWLIHLDLSGNCLKEVEGLAELNCRLKVLNLSKNEIVNISDKVFQSPTFQTMIHLDVSHNKLLRIPSSVVSMRTLSSINISDNRIKFLPYNWMDLTNLRFLNISENNLLFVPATLFYLQLASLDMSKNPSLQDFNNLKADYVGYSCIPTLFETACDLVMNLKRKRRLQTNDLLPSIVDHYLKAGKYCIRCGRLCLRYKITKLNDVPSVPGCLLSPALTPCLIKRITCFECDQRQNINRK